MLITDIVRERYRQGERKIVLSKQDYERYVSTIRANIRYTPSPHREDFVYVWFKDAQVLYAHV